MLLKIQVIFDVKLWHCISASSVLKDCDSFIFRAKLEDLNPQDGDTESSKAFIPSNQATRCLIPEYYNISL